MIIFAENMPKTKIEQLRSRLIKKVREEVVEKFSGIDNHIIKAVNVLDDLDNVGNLLAEHAREWYGFYFPELEKIAKENELFLKLVSELGEREKLTRDEISKIHENALTAEKIESAAKTTIGSEVKKEDLAEIKLLALNALNLIEERKYLEKYIDMRMKEFCPNISEIAGSVLGAKLLAKAGSLKRIALMPSSTIQVLGAEKALFMSRKKHAKGPKYGLLFSHALVKQMQREHKGKLARTLAGKIATAAKADYFTKRDISAELKRSLEARVKEISKR